MHNYYSTVFIDITYCYRKLLLRKIKITNNFIAYSRNFPRDPSTQKKASKDNSYPKTLWTLTLKSSPCCIHQSCTIILGFLPGVNQASSLSSTLKDLTATRIHGYNKWLCPRHTEMLLRFYCHSAFSSLLLLKRKKQPCSFVSSTGCSEDVCGSLHSTQPSSYWINPAAGL